MSVLPFLSATSWSARRLDLKADRAGPAQLLLQHAWTEPGVDEADGGRLVKWGTLVGCGDTTISLHRAGHRRSVRREHLHCAARSATGYGSVVVLPRGLW